MPFGIIHKFVSSKSDSSDGSLINPSNWNDSHTVTKTGEIINVMDYGAKGDGTTDDTSAIVNAIAAGDHIYFPKGQYKVTATITIPSGTILEGSGSDVWSSTYSTGSRIEGAYGGALFFIDEISGTIVIRNLAIDGNSVANSIGILIGGSSNAYNFAVNNVFENVGVRACGNNIKVLNAWGMVFSHVWSLNSLGHGLWICPPTTYPSGPPTETGNPPGTPTFETTTVNINNFCHFASNAGYGVYFQGLNNDISIEDSIMENNSLGELRISGNVRVARIENNYFESNSSNPSIKLDDGLTYSGYVYDPSGTIYLANNYVQGSIDLGFNNRINLFENSANCHHGSNHFNETIANLLPTSQLSTLGAELITNGSFAGGGTGWSANTGWTFGASWAIAVNVTGGNALWQNVAPVAGKWYRVSYDLTVTQGYANFSLGYAKGEARFRTGSYVEYIYTTGTDVPAIQGWNNFSGTVDNVSVRSITFGNVSPSDWVAVSFQNGWSDIGGSYTTTKYRLDAGGTVVRLQGTISGGTITDNTVLFQLATGYRPPLDIVAVGYDGNNKKAIQVIIRATGNVEIFGASAGSTLAFSGITFSIV